MVNFRTLTSKLFSKRGKESSEMSGGGGSSVIKSMFDRTTVTAISVSTVLCVVVLVAFILGSQLVTSVSNSTTTNVHQRPVLVIRPDNTAEWSMKSPFESVVSMKKEVERLLSLASKEESNSLAQTNFVLGASWMVNLFERQLEASHRIAKQTAKKEEVEVVKDEIKKNEATISMLKKRVEEELRKLKISVRTPSSSKKDFFGNLDGLEVVSFGDGSS